jgi:hypothetical protein
LAADNHFNGPGHTGNGAGGGAPATGGAPHPVEAPPTTRPSTPAETTSAAGPATPTTPHDAAPTLTPADATPTARPATPSEPAAATAPHPGTEPAAGPATPAAAPATAPKPPVSILKSQEIKAMKAHEELLKKFAGGSYKQVKYVDDWVKKNYPDQYPYLKGMSDAKSSKTFAGWAAKDIVNVDRQLTDIHERAQKAWEAANAQNAAAQNQNPNANPPSHP